MLFLIYFLLVFLVIGIVRVSSRKRLADLVIALLGGVLVILSILDATTQPLGRVYPARVSTTNAASTQQS